MGYAIKSILHNKAKTLLHMETEPGLGCTEPATLGLCAAAAASLLAERKIDAMEVTVNPSLYKNAMGVIIPASGGKNGVLLASALGAISGDPKNGLEIFSTLRDSGVKKAEQLLAGGNLTAIIDKKKTSIYVKTVIKSGSQTAEAVIADRHNHIQSLRLNGKIREDHSVTINSEMDGGAMDDLKGWLTSLSLQDILDLLEGLDSDDVKFIQEGIDLNMKLVEYGLSHGPGLGVGRTQLSLIRQGLLKRDMVTEAGLHASAGIDARMGGAMLPAMTLAGSGNQGIAATTPLVAVAQFAGLEDSALLIRAIALSYLITCTIKVHAGRIGPLCGSCVASGAGVAAGVSYLFGGTHDKIGGAIKNHMENTAMILCDGAKTGCALKVGEATASAVKSALLALQGLVVGPDDGIIDAKPETTMKNIGTLIKTGLKDMDAAILDLMLNKCT